MRALPEDEALRRTMCVKQAEYVWDLGALGRNGKRCMPAPDGTLVDGGNNIQHVRKKVCEPTGILTIAQDKGTAFAVEHEHGGTGWCGIKVETHL